MISRETERAPKFERPKAVFPFECDGFFPIPTTPTQRSPIEHIILIVKENKTFDQVDPDSKGQMWIRSS